MRIRLTCLLGVVVLVSVGFLMACGSHYSASSDGLLIVPSQGSDVLQSFSFNLSNGHTAQISTAPAVLGKPTAIVQDVSGAYVYVAIVPDASNSKSVTVSSIASYKINSDGTLTSAGTPLGMKAPLGAISPVALALDSSGILLFVADQATTASGSVVAGTVSVFSIGSGATLSEVSGSPFAVPVPIGGTNPSASSLSVTPTSFPAQHAVCSPPMPPPTSEFLYVADSQNNELLEYSIDMSSGALTLKPTLTSPGIATGSVPSGVTVDPCNRFVYVANQISNNVSAFSISSGSPVAVSGSPFQAANGPGPIAVDPFGNFVYVVNTLSNTLSGFKISPVTGALSVLSPATVPTGTTPNSIAIRPDGNWLFVANFNSASVSEYAITPASGALAPQGSITTDNFPMGLAVK